MIYPYLIYGNIVWANTYPSNLHKLYLLQKCFVRLATLSNTTDPSAPLFKKLNILPMYNINIHQVCVLYINTCFHPVLYHLLLKKNFMLNSQFHSYTTRQVDYLHLPFYKIKHGQFCLRYRGVQIWNAKRHIVMSSSSLKKFKRKLSFHLIHEV